MTRKRPTARDIERVLEETVNAMTAAQSDVGRWTGAAPPAGSADRIRARQLLARALADYEEALAAIAKQRPDLILMDIQLPIMDGYTATSQIKADPALRSIPIIAVTSYALAVEEKKARAAGCDDYVTKPFSPRQLLAKIRQYIAE